jgi:N-acetylneuraminate synthase
MNTIAIDRHHAIGPDEPCFIIAEIGINHNGSIKTALKLIEEAAKAGCNAVKFQKRTPEICTPRDQWEIMRDTPWGRMSYINYRYKVEFGEKEYALIDEFCKEKNIIWFASCWDEPSVDFLEKFNPLLYKAASASLTDIDLLKKKKATGKPLILSTGMSTMDEIFHAVDEIGTDNILIAHSTSAYPCPLEQLNLKMIPELQKLFPKVPIGYSGHETGLATTIASVVLGATFIERHFTIDRAMWGSDQAASVEPTGMAKLVKDIRDVETALGDGVKKLYDSEIGQRAKLRRVKEVTVKVENP